ncbi:hypothetical protein SKAU_G00315370 [Synaphobranchus kaupii]|uniref:Uncharacterized protein n=1 Tax=Synaphobranchus kaupii TaxID=118154 RepID=A0A9Q1ESP3_SYNKA|nr:hypothetical protein SKAU_G00315370 [Synaphobranchus kaupii]
MKGPNAETELVEEPSSSPDNEELPPYLREDPPEEHTMFQWNIKSSVDMGEIQLSPEEGPIGQLKIRAHVRRVKYLSVESAI